MFTCPLCNRILPLETNFANHMGKHHRDRLKRKEEKERMIQRIKDLVKELKL